MTAHGPLQEAVSPWTQTWLRRLLVSLVVGVCVGMLVFVIARGIGGIILFIQQQNALRDVAGMLGGGFDQPRPPIYVPSAAVSRHSICCTGG